MKEKKETVVLVTMAVGIFLCMLDTTVMNIALPAIQNGLHTDLATLQWALNVYTIVFAALTIPLGRIADQIGRNKVYLTGLILFFIGSLTSALSPTVVLLIIGRGLQSIGAAIIFPASMTIGIKAVRTDQRSKAVLVLGLTQGLAAAFGPTIGGFLTQFYGWRGIFYINIPLILFAVIMCLLLLPMRGENTIKARIDISGMLLAILMLFSLTLALVKGNDWGWGSFNVLALFAGCLLWLGLFIWRESVALDPMIRLDLFKYRHFIGAVVVTVLAGVFFVGMMVLMPSFFTQIQGHNELTAALMLTPASAMVFLCSPISGLLLEKFGSRLLIALGIVFLALGYAALSIMHPAVYWQFAIACVLIGVGYGVIIGPITVLSAGNFSGELLTASQSVTGVFRQIGTVLAVAIFVSALSANLTTARKQVWSDAQKEIKNIAISPRQRQHILKTTRARLHENSKRKNSDTQIAISQQDQSKLIHQEVQVYLDSHQRQQWSQPAKQALQRKISLKVKEDVRKVNRQVRRYQATVSKSVQCHMTAAFIKPYQAAMPFVWISLLSVFIFEKKSQTGK